MDRSHDEREVYCRMLGHVLAFRYCRAMQEGLPCSRILDCWFELMDIRAFVAANYTREELARIFAPAPSRLETLYEVVHRLERERSERDPSSREDD